MKFSKVLAFCCPLLLSTVSGLAQAANPFGISFSNETNVSLYGKPTGMLIAGRCNRYDARVPAARSKGAEVLAYLNPASRPDHRVCGLDQAVLHEQLRRGAAVALSQLRPAQHASGNTRMTDMRPGSKWIQWVVSYVEKLMRESKVDGVFLDTVGVARGAAAGLEDLVADREERVDRRLVDLVRRIDAKRRAINPNFIIVNNNIWAITGRQHARLCRARSTSTA